MKLAFSMAIKQNVDEQAIHKQVEQLSKAARKRLYDKLLPQFEEPIDAELSAIEHDCYETLTRVLGPIQRVADLIKAVGGRRKYRDRATMLFSIIAQGCEAPLLRAQRLALAAECLDCLVEWISGLREEGFSSARSPKVILEHMVNLRTAIEHNYPGYIEARMLHRLVQVAA